MMLAFAGLISITLSVTSLSAMLPKNGKVHRLATAPILEWLIPLGIVSGFTFGFALGLAALAASF